MSSYINRINLEKEKEEKDDLNELLFNGEYINGKKIGKEYDHNGTLIFEGEYLNGEKWNGKGKEFNYINDDIIFQGEYINGEKKWKM